MEAFFDEIRQDRIKLADVMDKHRGIRKIVEELYPDKAHFIYELLQNAEDTGASEIEFELSDKELRFNHNGRPFDKADIDSITDIGESSKQDNEDKIGRFGIGFKAVFAYTETPIIFSNNTNFRIERLVVPEIIEPSASNQNGTTFVFPFNNPKKASIKAFSEIKEGLELLNEQLLIFLQNIKLIKWKVNGGEQFELIREEHTVNHIEVIKYKKSVKISFSHWLRFSEKIPNKAVLNVSIAYPLTFLKKIKEPLFNDKLAISEQFEIKPISGSVSVYFPAEKEVSGLKFNIHAPFIPELSRASIKDTEANLPLYDLLALLTSSSLNSIKNLGLLNQRFLAVLPNLDDDISKNYLPILNSVHDELRNSSVIPTHNGGYSRASLLYQSKLLFKNLFSSSDLQYLVNDKSKNVEWTIGVNQKNNRQDKLLSNVGVRAFGIDELVDFLSENGEKQTYDWMHGHQQNKKFPLFAQWLKSKDYIWMMYFYSLLYKELESEYRIDEISDVAFIKSQSYKLYKGVDCYFPSKAGIDDKLIPRVNSEFFLKKEDKNLNSNVDNFFKEIGVNHYGDKDEVKRILKEHYGHEHKGVEWDVHIQHMKKFVEFDLENRNEKSVFNDHSFICDDQECVHTPAELFISSNYTGKKLEKYYQYFNESECEKYEIASKKSISLAYLCDELDSEQLIQFLTRLGVQSNLEIERVSCSENVKRQELFGSPGRWMDTRVNRDFNILGLVKFAKSKNVDNSTLIWEALNKTKLTHLKAYHRSNNSNYPRDADSQLVHTLKTSSWIPQLDGSFVKPSDARLSNTVDHLRLKQATDWSLAIGLYSKERSRSNEVQQKISHAKELGISVDSEEDIDDMKAFIALSKEKRSAFLKAEQNINRESFELPESSPRNEALRAERVKELATEAPDRVAEVRERSVQVGVNKVKAEAAEYLINQYTNDDGKMICQICQDELPFKDLKNDYYFQKALSKLLIVMPKPFCNVCSLE